MNFIKYILNYFLVFIILIIFQQIKIYCIHYMNIYKSQPIRIKDYVFHKEDLLGKGTSSHVYLAYNINNNCKLAIKIIDMKSIDNQVTHYLLHNQKKALSLLKHPNILNAIDIIQQHDYCYIITQYCNGGTLFNKINEKKKYQQKQALELFRGIVEGYKKCAEHEILHRDLKPSNILLHNNIPKISDFGYCDMKNKNKPKIFYNVGSPSYMSPEAYLQNHYCVKSDIWSLGIILFEMLTGNTIDRGKNEVETLFILKKEGIRYPSYVSHYCRDIINSCLNFDINNRITIDDLRSKINHNNDKSTIMHPITRDRIITPHQRRNYLHFSMIQTHIPFQLNENNNTKSKQTQNRIKINFINSPRSREMETHYHSTRRHTVEFPHQLKNQKFENQPQNNMFNSIQINNIMLNNHTRNPPSNFNKKVIHHSQIKPRIIMSPQQVQIQNFRTHSIPIMNHHHFNKKQINQIPFASEGIIMRPPNYNSTIPSTSVFNVKFITK